MVPYPCGSSSSLSLLPETPSNFSSRIETLAGRGLSRAHFVAGRVPGDHRLGPGSAGDRADAQDVAQRFPFTGVVKISLEIVAMGQHFAGHAQQRIDFDRRGLALARARPQHRCILQRTHAAPAGIAKALHRVGALRPACGPAWPARRRSRPCRSDPAANPRAAPADRGKSRAAGPGIHAPARSRACSAAKSRSRCARTPDRTETSPPPALPRARRRRSCGPRAGPWPSCWLTPGPLPVLAWRGLSVVASKAVGQAHFLALRKRHSADR